VWESVPKTTLNHLNVLHNKLIQAMNFASYRLPVTPLYHQSNLLKTNDIYHLEISEMMHCLHNGKLQQTFDDYFSPVISVHTQPGKPPIKYFLHSISSEHGKRPMKHHGPKIWDSVVYTLQQFFSIQKTLSSPPYLTVCGRRHNILDRRED